MTRAGAGVLLAAALAAGCGSGSTTEGSPATPPAPSGTATSGATASAPAVPSPSASPALTKDFGYFVGVRSRSPLVLSFDRAQLITGEAAQKAAAAHGDEALDVYLVNDNPRLRDLTLSPSVRVRGSIQLNGFAGEEGVELVDRPLPVFLDFLATKAGKDTPWNLVYGEGGIVTGVDEQYLP